MREMMALHGIVLPEHVTNSLDGDDLEKMVNMTLKMEKPLTNTLGQGWREKLTVEEIVRLYTNM
jgi:3-deoxy-alpha-D-manno-octulosonate 8-oxidase